MNLKLTLKSIFRRPIVRILRTLLPSLAILAIGLIGFGVWVVYKAAHPPQNPYLVTPDSFKILSDQGVKAAEETWSNSDGTKARGWLLRGDEGKPAVILLHHYSADRSWVLNLGVKLNEATKFTVLWPDLRGHGQSPPVKWTSFGGCETDDAGSAIEFLRSLKTSDGKPLVGENIGMYGLELGGYVSVLTAKKDPKIRALVLDSVPSSSETMLYNIVKSRSAYDWGFLRPLTRAGATLYLQQCFQDKQTCDEATQINNRHVMLLTGADTSIYRESTISLSACFPKTNTIERHSDLPLSGLNLIIANGEQSETYDRRVIDFFNKALAQ
jgi:pimeloyl-ACP methyl ester carboxylesterase